ncbi:eukaryotic translation initiation factor 4E-1B isoform X2 [Silurus meridionalis]|uniref:eukaryotic translation initiation factor 4E-1B isoform X2 n=1 Tax=Silurus meridionalis TaxID=175797 RepID=UPI001EEB7E8F|nr:eukaryotic translation initiation factor 4E-1B isoform X2 [Silurus meridionalis]
MAACAVQLMDKRPRKLVEKKETPVVFVKKVLHARHPLQNRWALWFYKNDKSKMWQDNLRLITKFDTVEDFWGVVRVLSSQLPPPFLPFFPAGCTITFRRPVNSRQGATIQCSRMESSPCGRTEAINAAAVGSLRSPNSRDTLISTAIGWRRCCASWVRVLAPTVETSAVRSLTFVPKETKSPSGRQTQRTRRLSRISGGNIKRVSAFQRSL